MISPLILLVIIFKLSSLRNSISASLSVDIFNLLSFKFKLIFPKKGISSDKLNGGNFFSDKNFEINIFSISPKL